MAISATFQFGASGGGFGAFVKKNLKDTYTVLALDYTIERSCDKTGRPSGGASISFIKVTIRAAKQMGAPFHAWIKGEDTMMDGVIKIYDSSGLFVSSTMQDSLGIDPLVDVDDAPDLLGDMASGAMNQGMDDASHYGAHDDIYDEMSRKDLLKLAEEKDITIKPGDSDDDIREKIRIDNEANPELEKFKKDLATTELKSEAALKQFYKDHSYLEWPNYEKEVHDMTQDQLETYVKNNKDKGVTAPDTTGLNDAQKKAAYEKVVREHKELVEAKALLKDDKRVKEKIKEPIAKEHKIKEVENRAYTPAYETADKLKKQTASMPKGVLKEAVKRSLECARSIEFEKAYCVSLKEHFTNKPDFANKLDSTYPWTLEIGIKPQKVTVSGEQVGPAVIGDAVDFKLY